MKLKSKSLLLMVCITMIQLTALERDAYANVIVALFDLSGSVPARDKEMKKKYLDDFRQVVNKKVKSGDCLFGLVITERSGSDRFIFKNECIPPSPGVFEDPKKQLEIVNQKNRILNKTKEAFDRSALGTDIIAGLRIASEIFKKDNSHGRVLIIFSDMVNESVEINMERHTPEAKDVERLLENWHQAGSVPDLKNVKVYAWGAGHPDEQRRVKIEQFWRRLFQALGAQVQEYSPEAINYGE